jgi:hypothetical protein
MLLPFDEAPSLPNQPSNLRPDDDWSHEEADDLALRRPLLQSAMVAHAFRFSSACVPARFDVDHILADVVHFTFCEAVDAPGPTQLSSGDVLLSGPSLEYLGFNYCGTAANVAPTLATSVALAADADDDPGEAPATSATTGGA